MNQDPLEMKNLARNPEYKTVLEKHRGLLKEYAEKSGDEEAKELLPKK